ncbi:MAG: hypothetical protein J6D03_08610 [Clostridia bacterium]|nr:hypothetical protein [Clostridia bacterium]
MKSVLKVIFVIMGTLIGAGFASGKEIYIFFNKYGICGIIGILISGLILGILIYKVFNILVKQKDIHEYNQLLNYIFYNRINNKGNMYKSGRSNENKNNKICKFNEYKNGRINIVKYINYTINIFLIISFYIMVAGFSSYFKQEYNISIYTTSTIFALLCYITLRNNIEGIIKISSLLVPIIIVFILNLGSKNFSLAINQIVNMNFFGNKFIESVISSVLYASYNSIILIPVLISLKKYINNKNKIWIGFFTTLIIIILSMFVYIILLKANVNIIKLDLPLIYIVKRFGKIYEYMYGAVIIISIFTSALSASYSFLKNCSKTKKGYNKLLILMCVTSIFIASIGFSELVNILYPIFGILGIIQIYYILKIKI